MPTLIGLHQLKSTNEVSVQCCQKSFSVSTPQDGRILYAKNKWLRILDVEKNPVIRTSNSWRWYPTMLEVTVWNNPPKSLLKPLYVKQTERCLIVNERDTKQVLLKVVCQGEFQFNSIYEIWSTNGFGDLNAEIGRITLDDNEFSIKFPEDMDVRCKAAIIGSCLMISEAAIQRDRSEKNNFAAISKQAIGRGSS